VTINGMDTFSVAGIFTL